MSDIIKSKELLVDCISFEISKDLITEMAAATGPFIVKGVLQRANAKNQNGRVYPRAILEREAIKYTENFVKQRRALGELDHPSCLLPTCDVFTSTGWKNITDLIVGETVATLNTKTNTLEYNSIEEVINQSYTGKMISFKGKNIDLTTTPNHRFILKDRKGEFLEKTAQELLDLSKTTKNTHLSIPTIADNYSGNSIETFIIPGIPDSINDIYKSDLVLNASAWFSFLGFYLAEGWADNRENKSGYGIYIAQNKNETSNLFREVLKSLSSELIWNEWDKNDNSAVVFNIADARLWTYLSKLGNKYTKNIPVDIKNASVDLLQNLYDWYVNGDGAVVGDYERTSLFSVSKQLIEDFYEIVLKLGMSAVIKTQISNNDYMFAGHIIEAKNKVPLYRLWIKTSKAIHLDFRFIKIQEIDYDSTVHCIRVKNGTFYCRDNNKSMWTGNSSVVNLQNVSHNVVELHWEGDDLVGSVEILTTPSGNILKELFKSSINVGISSRGVGSVKRKLAEAADEVQDDFELIGFDFVSNPSTQGAFLHPVGAIREGVDPSISGKNWTSVENIIREILGEIK